jgi:hypothetical protein
LSIHQSIIVFIDSVHARNKVSCILYLVTVTRIVIELHDQYMCHFKISNVVYVHTIIAHNGLKLESRKDEDVIKYGRGIVNCNIRAT